MSADGGKPFAVVVGVGGHDRREPFLVSCGGLNLGQYADEESAIRRAYEINTQFAARCKRLVEALEYARDVLAALQFKRKKPSGGEERGNFADILAGLEKVRKALEGFRG